VKLQVFFENLLNVHHQPLLYSELALKNRISALTKLIPACPAKRNKYVHEIISATNMQK